MPGSAVAALGQQRHGQLGEDQDGHDRHPQVLGDHEHAEPEHLHQGDPSGVAQGGGPQLGCAVGRPQPLRHHRHAHDHVPDDGDREVVVDEHRLDPGGQHEHAAHLHDGEHPVEPVVGVEGRREPGEVHPGPPDREEREGEQQDPVEHVPLGEGVVELDRGDADRHDEHEVEEQLEARRDPPGCVGVTRRHRDEAMGIRGSRHREGLRVEGWGAGTRDRRARRAAGAACHEVGGVLMRDEVPPGSVRRSAEADVGGAVRSPHHPPPWPMTGPPGRVT